MPLTDFEPTGEHWDGPDMKCSPTSTLSRVTLPEKRYCRGWTALPGGTAAACRPSLYCPSPTQHYRHSQIPSHLTDVRGFHVGPRLHQCGTQDAKGIWYTVILTIGRRVPRACVAVCEVVSPCYRPLLWITQRTGAFWATTWLKPTVEAAARNG
jgi:hypothetical protein